MTDYYVIVCRDGYNSQPLPKEISDGLFADWLRDPLCERPAYRIRIREKAREPRKLGVYPLPDGSVEVVFAVPPSAESTYRPDPFNNLPAPGLQAR
jgi:hypothetical protein